MYLHCPQCERYFDTNDLSSYDPEGIVCDRCYEARLDNEEQAAKEKPDAIDRMIAEADELPPDVEA